MISPYNSSNPYTLKISQAAAILGCSDGTIRNLCRQNLLPHTRVTIGERSHRRFSRADLAEYLGHPIEEEERKTDKNQSILLYARTSDWSRAKGFSQNGDQSENQLVTQLNRLRDYAKKHFNRGPETLIEFVEVGSGLNFERKKFVRLVSEIASGQHDGGILLVTFFERLSRLGYQLILLLCQARQIEIVCVEQKEEEDDPEADPMALALAVMQICTSSIYGKRSGEKKKIHIDPSILKFALEQQSEGRTWREVVSILESKGMKDQKNRPIRLSTLRNSCLRILPTLKEFQNREDETCPRFIEEKLAITGNEKSDRIQFLTLEKEYLKFCLTNELKPLRRNKLAQQLRKLLKHKLIHSKRFFIGVQLKS